MSNNNGYEDNRQAGRMRGRGNPEKEVSKTEKEGVESPKISIKTVTEYLIKEGVALSSMIYSSYPKFNVDEEAIFKRKFILNKYMQNFPKDVEGFWRVDSVGRFIAVEMAKSHDFKDSNFTLNLIPDKMYLPDAFLLNIRKIIDKRGIFLEKEDADKILRGYQIFIEMIDILNIQVYPKLFDFLGGTKVDRGENRELALNAYRQSLELINRKSDLKAFSEAMIIRDIIEKQSIRLYSNMNTTSPMSDTFFELITRGERSYWEAEYKSLMNNETYKVYAPIGFNTKVERVEGEIIATSISDFYLHTIKNKNEKELLNNMRLFFYRLNRETVKNKVAFSKEVDALEKDLNVYKEALTVKDLIISTLRALKNEIDSTLKENLLILFKSEDFVELDDAEQIIHIIEAVRAIIFEKKHLIPKTETKFYNIIRLELLNEVGSNIVNRAISIYETEKINGKIMVPSAKIEEVMEEKTIINKEKNENTKYTPTEEEYNDDEFEIEDNDESVNGGLSDSDL